MPTQTKQSNNPKIKILVIILVVALLLPVSVSAHSGRTDSNGCHTNKKTGDYHCHGAKTTKAQVKTTAKTKAKATTKSKTQVYCSSNLYNCADFSSQKAAQVVYEACLKQVGRDVHDLDRDKDGKACEANK